MKALMKEFTKITLKPKELLMIKIKGDISTAVFEAVGKQLKAKFDKVFGRGTSDRVIVMAMPESSDVEFTKITKTRS